MGWSYNFWLGGLYPKGLTSDNFLKEYSKHFDTVEVDNTFYRIPNETTVAKWRDQTPEDFLFAAKFPKIITHQKMLRNCERELERFIKSIDQLQTKLGPLLLQFPATFKADLVQLLGDFLPNLPKRHRFAVEVRNEKLLNDRLYSVLRENAVALAIVDSPFMPDVEVMTANFTYVRWEGDRKKVKGTLGKVEVDRTVEVKIWTDKIRKLLDTAEEVFGYFSKYYSGSPADDARQLLSFLRSE